MNGLGWLNTLKLRRALLYGFAAFGVFSLFSIATAFGCRSMLFVDELAGTLASPSGELRVLREVTRGGLGTVWTTRLYIEDKAGSDRVMIYSNSDSDFVTGWKWSDDERLMVRVPCGRVDFMASPSAYAPSDEAIGRVRVHFLYDWAACARQSEDDE